MATNLDPPPIPQRKLIPRSTPQKCRCPLSEEGCDWTGKLEDVNEHMSVCQRSLIDVECPYKVIGCEVGLLAKREMDEHLKECQILHQQLLLKKVIGSNEQRNVKKKFELESSWVLIAVIVMVSVIVLGVSVFVQYQTQSNNEIEILKDQFGDELKSFKNNLENKIQGMDNTLKDLKNKIEIESQSTDNARLILEGKIERKFQRIDSALISLERNIENSVHNLRSLIDEKINDFEKKMAMAFKRMYQENESRYSKGIIMDILSYVFGSTRRLIGM